MAERSDNPQPLRPKEPVPTSSSREEEAEFWDTHDFADYWDDFESVDARFGEDLSHGITVWLDAATLTKLEATAHEHGVDTGTLVRLWILDHLDEPQTKTA